MPEPLKLYNTLTRSSEIFKPIKKSSAGMYTCGPTVYHYAHIGNLRAYVFEDVLKRVLKMNEYKVKHVMNITDVGHLTSDADTGEDKMVKGAKREGKTAWEVAAFYTAQFKKDIKALNIMEPDIWCRATDHIKEQIEMVQKLEKKGYTYIIPEDGVYYDTTKFENYGELGRLNVEGQKEGARVEFIEGKKNKADFALWKFSPKEEKRDMEWESPWGKGFPGWHIECSAMAMKYLGEHFDIHCGGVDHIQVHHTNEIAQAEGATGKKFVNYWLHNEFLIIENNEKMAKSGENFLTLNTLRNKDYDPIAYRYLLLTAHYRSKLAFSWEALTGAKTALTKLKNYVIDFKTGSDNGDWEKYKEEFQNALNDDLDTPRAISIMWTLVKDEKIGAGKKREAILYFDKILGLRLEEAKEEEIPEDVKELIRKREIARTEKKWKESDETRAKLRALGYEVSDTPEGQTVRRIV